MILTALAIFGLVFVSAPAMQAQTCNGNGSNFVDLDGDGFNDNAPDADGDGIPNGLDEDYVKPEDGTGQQKGQLGGNKGEGMAQTKTMTKEQKFNKLQAAAGAANQHRNGASGSMSGSGTGVCDGTGGGSGSGVCDGTGPKGGKKNGGGK